MNKGTTYFGGCGGACPGAPDANANGIIDEPHVYIDATSLRPLANGGLTSDTNEYVGDTTRNFVVFLQRVDASRRGQYFLIGADGQFRGLNVTLATAGAGTGLDLQWQYWDGTQWANVPDMTLVAKETLRSQLTLPHTVPKRCPCGRVTR